MLDLFFGKIWFWIDEEEEPGEHDEQAQADQTRPPQPPRAHPAEQTNSYNNSFHWIRIWWAKKSFRIYKLQIKTIRKKNMCIYFLY